MKTTNQTSILIMLIILIGMTAHAQNFLPTPSTNINPTKNEHFTRKSISDTTWLYGSYKTFSWQDEAYVLTESWTYHEYLDQNAPTRPSLIHYINSITEDTIMVIHYEYDTLQRVSKQTNYEIIDNGNILTATNRWIYAYDKFSNDTLVLWQKWNNSTYIWEHYMQTKREFSNRNFFLQEKIQQWDQMLNLWFTMDGSQYNYSYNEAGCPDTLIHNRWNYDKKGWDNYIIQYWTYDENNIPLEYWFEIWIPELNKYQNFQRFFNLEYRNWPGCEDLDHTYKHEFYNFNQQNWLDDWIDVIQFSFIYDDFNGYEAIMQSNINNEWQNSQKRQVRFNNKGLNIYKDREYWIDGQWKLERADTSIFIYEGDKMVEFILDEADTAHNNDWMHFSKFVFGDYIWHVGIDDYFDNDGSQINKITVIPNPSAGNISIELKNKSEAIAKLELIDISGKVVLQERSYNPGSNRVEIENTGFEKGIYIVKVLTRENKVYYTKLIIN